MSSTSAEPAGSSAASRAAPPPLTRWESLLTVSTSGAVVMLVEIMGTRIIGPVYGVSLFVWAALLSVTLCALAVGYYWGGVLIFARPRARGSAGPCWSGALGWVPCPYWRHRCCGR